ncbi:hypothetical protein RAB80_014380 [Fusarium oxysporum f. sp. vasinfectum]|nr:hypothetical protein RAB80_017812 [Fusarium oxysporum f. sp. vasinfectum]KAK2670243.1 hypothetical protein RAB80_014380 [Fusarium oxysporum f. sp. vasinfectum]
MENGCEASGEPPSLELAPQHQYFKSPRRVTPPERASLPSPPATIEAERIRNSPNLPRRLLDFKRKAESSDVEPLIHIPISPAEYASASDQIESAFPRFDYEPKLGRITLRMPSPTHDTFVYSLSSSIEQEILRIGRDNNQVREFTSQIKGGGSSRIYLEDKEKQNKICEFLDDAEKVQNARESRGTSGIRSTRKLRKRELSSSSLEELAQDDEARFKEQEEAVDTRASHRDDAFVPRPGDANIIHRDHDLRPRAAKRRA